MDTSLKQDKFLKELQKTLQGGAVEPEELVEAIEFLLGVIDNVKKTHSENKAKTKEEIDALYSELFDKITKTF